MDIAAFLLALQRRASPKFEYPNPLRAATLYLQLNPDTAENRALRKLLKAIATGEGTMRESEICLFSGELASLTAALLDARLAGRYTKEEWLRACAF